MHLLSFHSPNSASFGDTINTLLLSPLPDHIPFTCWIVLRNPCAIFLITPCDKSCLSCFNSIFHWLCNNPPGINGRLSLIGYFCIHIVCFEFLNFSKLCVNGILINIWYRRKQYIFNMIVTLFFFNPSRRYLLPVKTLNFTVTLNLDIETLLILAPFLAYLTMYKCSFPLLISFFWILKSKFNIRLWLWKLIYSCLPHRLFWVRCTLRLICNCIRTRSR